MEKINAEVFLTVARLGSFRKAADALGYTQAGISYIINAMETELGLILFDREHDGVKLSSEGKAIMPHMISLESWEHIFEQTVNEVKGLKKGSVRVQVFDSISIHWLPGIIKRFNEDYPDIQVTLVTEDDSKKAETLVLNKAVDCGFFQTRVSAKIETFPLIEDRMLACVSPEHELSDQDIFPLADLGKYPYIQMKYDEHDGVKEIFKKYKIKPQTAFKLDNDHAAMAMVSKGLGFAVFPELLLRKTPYELHCMEFDTPQKRIISIGCSSYEGSTKACRKFIEYTRSWVNEHYKGHRD